jgi:serine protease Do
MRDLPRIVAESPVGEVVDVLILRDGEEQTVEVTLGRLEDGEEEMAEAEGEGEEGAPDDAADGILGLTLSELDESTRSEFAIGEDVEGVVVTEVDPVSEAGEKGVQPGEVIVEVAQEQVSTPDDVSARIDELRENGRRNALLMIANAEGELRFVTLRVE